MDGGMIDTARALLTEADLAGWRERRIELIDRMTAARIEFERVNRCIDLAEQLIALKNGAAKPEEPEAEPIAETDDSEPPPENVSALIRAAIEGAFTTGVRHKRAPEIRERVRRDDKVRAILDATPNAFYSVVYRMHKTGKLVKTRRGYRLAEPASLQKRLDGSGLFASGEPGPVDTETHD